MHTEQGSASSPSTSISTDSIFHTSRDPSPALGEPVDASSTYHKPNPTEQPYLRRTHYTSGYRAGITAGSADPLTSQAGFDAGYPIGAALAARAGWILSCLSLDLQDPETVEGGAGGEEVQRQERRAILRARLGEAERELGLASLLGEMRDAGFLDMDGAGRRETEDCEGEAVSELGQRDDAPRSLSVQNGFVDRLPSVLKWEALLREMGLKARPG